MSWVDLLILALVGLFLLRGYMRGAAREGLSLTLALVVFYFVLQQSAYIEKYLNYFQPPMRSAVTLLIAYMMSLFLVNLLDMLLANVLKGPIQKREKFMGGVLGGLHGVLLIGIAIVAAERSWVEQPQWWADSQFLSQIGQATTWLKPVVLAQYSAGD